MSPREAVLAALREHETGTTGALAWRTGLEVVTVASALRALLREGVVEDVSAGRYSVKVYRAK